MSRDGDRRASPLLEAVDLVVRYPVKRTLGERVGGKPKKWVRAVDGVSLSVSSGEMLALVGESGCGKTTMAQALVRMVNSTRGIIRFEGNDITGLSASLMRPIRSRLQMVYQDPYASLDPRFRVRQLVEEPMLVHGVRGSRSARRKRVEAALERVELSPPELFADRYPHELSGGQRQRVAIAASLVLGPKVLIADEPVSMLDVSVRAGVLSLLNRLRRDGDMGILMITHDLSTAVHFADRIAVMYLGRVVEEGPARDLVSNARHPYTLALLGAVPKRDPRLRLAASILEGETPSPIDIPTGCRFYGRCPIGEDRCKETDPELRVPTGLHISNHRVACLLADRPSDTKETMALYRDDPGAVN